MYSYQPRHPLLRSYVKQIYSYTLHSGDLTSVTIVPTGNLFLALLWGNEEYFIQRPKSTQPAEGDDVIVSGQQLEIGNLWVREGQLNVIVFELTPCAIYQFFGISQKDMTGLVFNVEDLCCQSGRELAEQAAYKSDPASQIALIEQFLCQRIISKQWKENAMISEAIHLIRQSNGNLGISALADTLRVSSRTLQRKFLQAVGISPKAYGNITRFNYAFKQCMLYKKHILDVVSEAGYYDQPHFVHHFKKVFGTSPGQFFEEQENVLYFLRKEEDQYSMQPLVDTLTHLQKLYVF